MASIILSTRNPSKILQIRPIFDGLPVDIVSLDEAGIEGGGVEDGETLQENAYKKAFYAWQRTKNWSLADDSGIFIDALNGRPGVYSTRWAGEDAETEDIMRFTLKQLEGVPEEERTATFRTVAVLITPDGPDGKVIVCTGEAKGSLLTAPRGRCQPNMAYSSLFVPDGQEKVWNELTIEEVNALSHRGKAFRQIRDELAALL